MNDPSFLMLLIMMIHPDPTFRPSRIEMQTLIEIYKKKYVFTSAIPLRKFSNQLSKELKLETARK
jgi:hypothetical protein